MDTNIHTTTEKSDGTFLSYTIGFVLSIVLTLAAYVPVASHMLSGNLLVGWIILLALIQFFIQLFFFLHIGKGKSARWNIAAISFTLIIITIVVGGSLWIMHHLNNNMMPRMESGASNDYSPQTMRD